MSARADSSAANTDPRDLGLRLPLHGLRLIEASAGTGKTFTLVTVLLRLVLERGVPMSQLLAVTFTRAATQELRERLRRRLWAAQRVIDGAAPAADDGEAQAAAAVLAQARAHADAATLRLRLRTARAQLDEALISTIHGFCQRALREFGFLAGALGDVELVDSAIDVWEETAAQLWREAAALHDDDAGDATADAPLRDRAGLHALLHTLWGHPDALARALPTLCDPARALWPRKDTSDNATLLHALRDRAQTLFDALMARRGARTQDALIAAVWQASEDPAFAAALGARWPLLLIDEFQDTDARQWDTFRRMWDATDPARRLLCLIGDPKQAIYRFRGGDIATYRRAAQTVAQQPAQRDDPPLFDLTANRRSTPSLLRALEALFEFNGDPFRGAGIDFKRVEHAGRASDEALRMDGASAKALTLHWLPQLEPDETAHGASAARKGFRKSGEERELMVQAAVTLVAECLAHGTLSGRPLRPAEIAILTQTNNEAASMRTALARARIAAALLSRDSVFDSEAAHDLRVVLHAIVEQDNPGLSRAALATPLLGLDAAALAVPEAAAPALAQGGLALEAAAERWRSRGPLPALLPLVHAAAHRWLGERDGARRLTDTLHLCELLQAEAALRPTPAEVLRWFEQRMRDRGEVEAEQLRLEADAGMVQVTTVHKAKGLEYPVVILPFAALRSEGRKSKLRTVDCQPPAACVGEAPHLPVRAWLQENVLELTDARIAATAKEARNAVIEWEKNEALQEEQRKLYVALTRAQYALHVIWSRNDSTDSTALHWLLHGERTIGIKPDQLLAQEMRQQLDALASHAPHAIAIRDVDARDVDPQRNAAVQQHVAEAHRRSRAVQTQPPARIARRGLGIDPRLHSFSSLHARSEQAEAERGAADEFQAPVEREDGADALSGSGFGNVVHAVLEAADFAQWAPASSTPADSGAASGHRRRAAATAAGQRELFAAAPDAPREDPDAIPPAQAGLIERALRREGIAPTSAHAAQTARLVRRALCVPLPGGVVLHALPQTSLVRELGFHFRLRPTRLDALYALLDAHGYPRHRRAPAATLAGYMHGFIDLVYRDDAGRHYVLDYKTNRLPAYDTASLRQSVARQDYDLQYLIYLVALRRWLRLRRGPAFDPAQEIGGAVYLFLRGISLHAPAGDDDDGAAGRDGVHVDAVAPELLGALDALFDGVPGAAEHAHAGATA